jgi:hypothetical protein
MTHANAYGARVHSRTGARGSPSFFTWAGDPLLEIRGIRSYASDCGAVTREHLRYCGHS